MKFVISSMLALALIMGIASCNKLDDNVPSLSGNTLALAIDYTTNDFMGGYTLPINTQGNKFEITHEYKAPGDFGSIQLFEKHTNTTLFYGTIVWSGKGRQVYPLSVMSSRFFEKISSRVDMPELNRIIETPTPDMENPAEPDYDKTWEAVSNLKITREFIQSNDGADVYIYLYKPSVGVGDPKDWYWLIFMHK